VNPGRDLVDQRPVGAGEEFDGQHADVPERIGNPAGDYIGLVHLPCDWIAGGQLRAAQDAAVVGVARAVPYRTGAVLGPRQQHRKFSLKFDRGFGDAGGGADRLPGLAHFACLMDPGLALAVIAEAAALEHDRQPKRVDGRLDVVRTVDRPPRCHAPADTGDELLLDGAILGTGERAGPGAHFCTQCRERRHRQILEFVGDDIDRGGEFGQGFAVVERGPGMRGCHGRGAGRFVGGEDVAAIAELGRRHCQHATQLAATDDADGGTRRNDH